MVNIEGGTSASRNRMLRRTRQEPETDANVADTDAGNRVTALLHRIVARASTIGNEEFRQFGVNIQGARVLIALLDAGSMRVGEIGQSLSLDLSTLSHLLRRFSRNGLLTRSRNAEDNRSVSVTLKPKGRKIAQICKAARVRHEEILLNGFSESERKLAQVFLRRICANIEKQPTGK